MLSPHTQNWIFDTLDQNDVMEKFLSGLGVKTEDLKAVLETIERGLSGDKILQQGAIQYLARVPEEKRAWQIDHDLLKSIGIDPIFAMALLHSFGPNNQTGDFEDDQADDIRGLLTINLPSLQKHTGRATLCLVIEDYEFPEDKAWELQVNIALAENIYWRTDFRGDTAHDGPDILLEETQFPESVATASANKHLVSILSHPILNAYPLIAGNIKIEDPDVIIDVEGAKTPMNLQDLIAAA